MINHGVEESLISEVMRLACDFIESPCMFSLRRINKNEELTFDYVNSTKGEQIQTDDELDDELVDSIENEQITEISKSSAISSNGTEISDEVVIKKDINDVLLIQQEIDEPPTTTELETKTPIAACDSPKENDREGFTCKCGAANCRKVIFC